MDAICYAALCDSATSQALAFTYLDEARKLFESEAEKEFGKSYMQKLEPSGKLLFAGKVCDQPRKETRRPNGRLQ